MSIDTTAPIRTSTVYATANPDHPPKGYVGRHREPDPKRPDTADVNLDTLLTDSAVTA